MAVQNITSKFELDSSDLDKLDQKFDGLIKKNQSLEKEVSEVSKEFTQAAKSADSFGKEADTAGKKATDSLKNTERQAGLLGGSFNKLGGLVAGVFAVDQILQWGKAFVDMASNIQKTAGVLANQLGSQSAAQKALLSLNNLSREAKIPLDTLTDAYMKLVGRGIRPTQKELLVFSDIANSAGKSIDQLIEAVLDAQTGEFERLKEFGIKARSEGDKIVFTFKEKETAVRNTSDAIKEYLIGLGTVQGVSGATAAATKGINEELIRFDNNLGAIGKKLSAQDGIFTKGLNHVNNYIDKIIIGMTSLEDLKLEKASKQTQEYLDIIGDTKSQEDFAAGFDYIRDKIQEFQVLQAKSISEQKKLEKTPSGFLDSISGNSVKQRYDKQKLIYDQAETQIKALQDAYEELNKRQDEFLNPKPSKTTTTNKKTGKPQAGPQLPEIAAPELPDFVISEEPWEVLFKHYDEAEKRAKETPQKALEYNNKMFGIEMPAAIAKFTDAELEEQKRQIKQWEEHDAAVLELRQRTEEEAFNFAVSSANAYMDFRAQQLSDELGMLQAMREADLVLAGDNEQAKHDINVQFAEKEKEIRKKQAANDRNQALFNIAISTAQGIMSVLATGGGTRYADFGISAGILTALVAATGAVQAALVLARPLPQFFKGTESSPEGFAWVGERGAEGKITPDGRFSVIPGGAHIEHLERGTKIIPNHKLADFMDKEIVTPSVSISDSTGSNIDYDRLGAAVGNQLSKVTVQQDIYDEKGYRSFVRNQNQRKERLERKNRFNRNL